MNGVGRRFAAARWIRWCLPLWVIAGGVSPLPAACACACGCRYLRAAAGACLLRTVTARTLSTVYAPLQRHGPFAVPSGQMRGLCGLCTWPLRSMVPRVRFHGTLTQRYAERMRRGPTRAERALERMLNDVDGGRLRGSFVRQWAFGGEWILDFYFRDRRVGIEVDGRSHLRAERKRRDALKERACERRGIVLVRVTNEAVLSGSRIAVLRKLREGWIAAAALRRCALDT